jgi:hypothetical protein
MQKYLRLLTYENACKVIEFINKNDKEDYAHVTPGGVSMQVFEKNWSKVEDFIKSLNVRYEVGTEAPHKVEAQIVSSLKAQGVIKTKEPKIKKQKNKFVYFNAEGTNMGSMDIATGKFVGATLCMMALYDHLEKYKETPEYLEQEKARLEKSIQGSTNNFHKDLTKLEDVEQKLKKKL